MHLLRIILTPFTPVYSLIIKLKNHLFNIGYSRSFKFEIPVIVIGNLSIGGSGKTPVVEYLIELLKSRYTLATLSRGYKRGSRGFRIAEDTDDAGSIGDEPYQIFRKYGQEIVVAVGEDRADAIPKILFERPKTQLILMDDGYQHRSVTPYFSILTTPYSSLFTSDHLLPVGNLREHRREARRADYVIVTKCSPNISAIEMEDVTGQINLYNSRVQVFFSTISYMNPVALDKSFSTLDIVAVVVISGIGDSEAFEVFVSTKWKVVLKKSFPDHESYTVRRLEDVARLFRNFDQRNTAIITTEKDAVKLITPEAKEILRGIPIFYVPIFFEFINNGAEFDQSIVRRLTALTKK